MREISREEIEAVSGGNVLAVVAAAIVVYEAADILYQFGQGVVAGYQSNDKV